MLGNSSLNRDRVVSSTGVILWSEKHLGRSPKRRCATELLHLASPPLRLHLLITTGIYLWVPRRLEFRWNQISSSLHMPTRSTLKGKNWTILQSTTCNKASIALSSLLTPSHGWLSYLHIESSLGQLLPDLDRYPNIEATNSQLGKKKMISQTTMCNKPLVPSVPVVLSLNSLVFKTQLSGSGFSFPLKVKKFDDLSNCDVQQEHQFSPSWWHLISLYLFLLPVGTMPWSCSPFWESIIREEIAVLG